MKPLQPATRSTRRNDAKLLVVENEGKPRHFQLKELPQILSADDLVVVNDAATMPSRLIGKIGNQCVEIRLALHLGDQPKNVSHWLAVSIGLGDYNTPTEDRLPGYAFQVGDCIEFGGTLKAIVKNIAHINGRLIEIEFCSPKRNLFQQIYEAGNPIQYSYLEERLEDWDQQTIFSGPAVAVEPPSSGFHLDWAMVLEMKKIGIQIVTVTHATGLSTTGDKQLDLLLPLPELSIISKDAAEAINGAKANGRRIIAIGTGASRAVEAATLTDGRVIHGSMTSLVKLNSNSRPQTITALLSGLHEEGTSHWSLLESFISTEQLRKAYKEAQREKYLGHEYGDLELVFSQS